MPDTPTTLTVDGVTFTKDAFGDWTYTMLDQKWMAHREGAHARTLDALATRTQERDAALAALANVARVEAWLKEDPTDRDIIYGRGQICAFQYPLQAPAYTADSFALLGAALPPEASR